MAIPALLGAAARLLGKEALKGAIKNKIKGKAKDKVTEGLKGKAKKISKEKLLGKKKDRGGPLALKGKGSSSIVPFKTPKILERKTPINLAGPDLKSEKKSANSKTYAAILKEIQSLNKTFDALKKSISSKNASDKKAISDRRKQLNLEKKRAREDQLESRKSERDSGGQREDGPKLGIFELIKRFFSNILIGGLLTLLLKNQGKVFKAIDLSIQNWRNITRVLVGFRKPFLRLLGFTSKVLLNPLYLPGKILRGTISLTGKTIKTTFSTLGKAFKAGINGIFKFGKKLIDAARSGVNLARQGLNFGGRAARAFTGALRGGQGVSGATQAVGTAAQRSARQAQQAKEARQAAEAARKARDAKKASQAASTATQATRATTQATTQATRATTQATTQAATSAAAKTARRAIKIPVIGPLLVAIDSWLSGDPPSQTLFKTGGAAIGGLLGNFIPIPILGMMLGEYIGEYVGNLFYHGLKTPGGWKKAGEILWNDLKKAFDTGKTVMDWLQKGVGRYINNWPKLRIPNPGFPGPLKSILEATVLWKKPMKGLHQFLGGHPISPFKFIADNQWFGNKKGEFSQIPDPTFSVRNPIGFLKHIKNSFLGTADKKPEYTPADLGDMSFPSDGSGNPPAPGAGDRPLGETFDATDSTGPSKQAGGAVSSQSAGKIVSSMGFSAEDFNLFKNTVAEIESGGRYDVAGGSGGHYDGRYQMGAAAKTDGARYAGIKDPGHGAAAREAFRKNPQLQETLFAGYTKANHTYLMGNAKYKNANPQRKLQILGYAHNQGMGGAERWLNTGQVGVDGFLTKGTEYTDAIAREFRKRGKGSSSPAQANLPPTPAAPVSSAKSEPSKVQEAVDKTENNKQQPTTSISPSASAPPSSPGPAGQISQAPSRMDAANAAEALSNRGPSGAVVPVPIPMGGGQQQVAGGGRSRGMLGTAPASSIDVLNSYYRLQLLGFLYKQG